MCGAAWNAVFRGGDVFTKAPPRKAPQKGRDSRRIAPDLLPSVPRRKRSHTETSRNTDGNPREKKVAHNVGPIYSQPMPNAPTPKPVAYSFTFDVAQPLGFYCVTDRCMTDRSSCVITSVCPSGQSKQKTTLIQKGTCGKNSGMFVYEIVEANLVFPLTLIVLSNLPVESIEVQQGSNVTKHTIHGHQDLSLYYSFARDAQTTLKVWFNNSRVESLNGDLTSSAAAKAPVNSDWYVEQELGIGVPHDGKCPR